VVVKTLVSFHEEKGSIFDGWKSLNVSCVNAIYKHIHHGEYTNMHGVKTFLFKKLEKKHLNFFFTKCKFVTTCHGKNVICDCTMKTNEKK
jgi:hypothetical protein